jgi:hypothetical protein
MKNINELRALTDKQLENPNTQRIAYDQLDRLGKIAARHNAQLSKGSFEDKVRAERIASALGARGANVRVDKKDGRTITHQAREYEPDGFGGENEIIMPDHAPIHRNSSMYYDKPLRPTENQRHIYGIRGKNLSRFAKQMRKNGQTGRYPASGISEENNMKNINELTAFTNDQLQNPLTRTIAQDQLGRLRQIAADHNANPNKKAGYGDRISTMMTTRGAAVAASLKNSVLRLPFSRDEKAVPVSHDTKLDSREINQDDRFRSSEYGDERRRDRRQLAARRREDNRGVADANRRGFKTPEGITEKNNMNIKQYYKQILNSEINEKLIGKQHKIDADGNKKITRNDFAIINARKKSAMNRVTNEMYGTLGRQAVNNMQNNASAQKRPLSPDERAATVRQTQNASRAAATARQQAAARKKKSPMNEATPAEMNQVDEMALTKNAFDTMLKGVKKNQKGTTRIRSDVR